MSGRGRGVSPQKVSLQGGMSLIELMIAMTIGLIILTAVAGSYVSGLRTQRMHVDVSHLQESGRFAFDLLARAVRRAGYRNTYLHRDIGAAAGMPSEFCSTGPFGSQIFALNGPASIDPGAVAASMQGALATTPMVNQSDVLRVRFFGEDNAIGTAADGSIQDCLGNSVRRGGNNSAPIEDTFYVATDSTTDPSNPRPALFCRNSTTGGAGTPLIPGVESLQLLYGEDIDGDGRIDRYLPYNLIANPDNVLGIMASVVLATKNAVSPVNVARTFSHFGADYAPANVAPVTDVGSVYVAPADGRIRLHMTTTFAFRNFRQC